MNQEKKWKYFTNDGELIESIRDQEVQERAEKIFEELVRKKKYQMKKYLNDPNKIYRENQLFKDEIKNENEKSENEEEESK